MKKILITLAVFSISQLAISQNIEGRATYLSKLKIETDSALEGQDLPEGLKGMIAGLLKKQTEKEYVLEFTNTESTFKEVEQVDNSINSNGISVQSMTIEMNGMSSAGSNLYKNLKEGTYMEESETLGKKFLVVDKILTIDWVLTKETKTIGKYKCNKAYYISEYESLVDPLKSDKMEMVKDTVVAWYSTQIPVSNGPKFLSGLPGLVLEYSNSAEIYQCSQVVLNPAKRVEITKPTKGKRMNAKDFKKLMDKKNKEQMESLNNLQSGDDNTYEIRIGN